MKRTVHPRTLTVFAGIVLSTCVAAFGQTPSLDLETGAAAVETAYNRPLAMGLPQAPLAPNTIAPSGLAFYTAHYTSLGKKALPFNIVGTDPSLGSGTTVIPAVIVPIRMVFAATGVTLDATNVTVTTANSPLFLVNDYTTGGTDVGITQYGDAIQRAEFWNLPGFSPAGYHVLLGTPTVQPTVIVNVPAGQGTTFALRSGGQLGVVASSFLDSILNNIIAAGAFTPNVLPIFLTDNVFESPAGGLAGCCILGYHASEGPPIKTAQTWIFAAYTEAGTFVRNAILDVQPLSHEASEWMNDPFVGTPLLGGVNLVAPAVLPGTGGACIINFEDGDPLEAPPIVFTQTLGGTTYHLQDEAFLPWYLHGASFSANGFYSYLGTFTTPSTLCGPG